MSDVNQQLKNLMARTRTDALMLSLEVLSATITAAGSNVPFEVRQAHAWTCEELEARFPEVEPVLDAWVDDHTGDTRPFARVLLDAITSVREGKH